MVQRAPWTKRNTYGAIADSYVDFTVRNYGTATVVFDGYQDIPSIKDNIRDMRQQRQNPLVSVSADTVFSGEKDEFLSRRRNKQALINIISARLQDKGCNVINCEGDADCEIVHAAIAASGFWINNVYC